MYELDPWGDQRADQRHAAMVRYTLMPHTRDALDPADFLLYPDDAHDMPDDLTPDERRAWRAMDRAAS